jgi:FAD/FMN-containing dehydrogenase
MTAAIPAARLERTDAWGGAATAMAYVYRPSTMAGISHALAEAHRAGVPIAFRGSGYSYGDAPFNSERVLVDMSRMNRILHWDPESGVISVEPGVTIERLWRYVLGDGWWPPVVPGTMFPTVGGCLGMNIHGKNNWASGTLGDHTIRIEAMLPSGELLVCDRDSDAELFYGMIGSLGLLGCFTRITLQMHKINSGTLKVRSLTETNIRRLVERMEELKDHTEYLVGWVDGTARGGSRGRGQIHTADYLDVSEAAEFPQSLRLSSQDLPEMFFGMIPKSTLWMFMRPFMNNLGVLFINRGRYWSARWKGDHVFHQSLAEFNFLLDYVPNWKRAYQPLGLVQFQCFLPADLAAQVIDELLLLCQRSRLPPYLGVLKRHRPDDFLLSHAVDGYSIAFDYRVTRNNRSRLAEQLRQMEDMVVEAGGRFYFAKDSALKPETAMAFLGDETIEALRRLKERCDPAGMLQSNLSRRVFPGLVAAEPEGFGSPSAVTLSPGG